MAGRPGIAGKFPLVVKRGAAVSRPAAATGQARRSWRTSRTCALLERPRREPGRRTTGGRSRWKGWLRSSCRPLPARVGGGLVGNIVKTAGMALLPKLISGAIGGIAGGSILGALVGRRRRRSDRRGGCGGGGRRRRHGPAHRAADRRRRRRRHPDRAGRHVHGQALTRAARPPSPVRRPGVGRRRGGAAGFQRRQAIERARRPAAPARSSRSAWARTTSLSSSPSRSWWARAISSSVSAGVSIGHRGPLSGVCASPV